MSRPDPARVASSYHQGRAKTAGEVRFIKDRGGDKSEWAWNTPGPSQREIDEEYQFKPQRMKPLAQTLRSTLMAMGHATAAHNAFVKIKSSDISPDGSLGGKGYIQKIGDMRRQLMNCVEALSALSDTLYDEINAPHWNPDAVSGGPREREEVTEIIEDAEEIREDPEGWAAGEEAEMDAEHGKPSRQKKASAREAALITRFWVVSDPHHGEDVGDFVFETDLPQFAEYVVGTGPRFRQQHHVIHDSYDSAKADALSRLRRVYRNNVPQELLESLQDPMSLRLASTIAANDALSAIYFGSRG